MSVQTNQKTGQGQKPNRRPEPANLDCRYGKIGIPAVAAALRCWTENRPARAAASARIDERFIELVA